MPPPTTSTSKGVSPKASKSRARMETYLIVGACHDASLHHFVLTRGLVTWATMPDNAQVREYWNSHIHDLEISSSVPGSKEVFGAWDAGADLEVVDVTVPVLANLSVIWHC